MRTSIGMAAALALAVALSPDSAHATAASQVTLSGFKIFLIDLAPDDAVAPSIRFVGEGEFTVVGPSATGRVKVLNAATGSEIYNQFFNNSGPAAPFSDVGGQAAFANTEAFASFTADDQKLGLHDLRAQGHAQSPAANASAYFNASVTAPSFYARSFELSSYTLAMFQGDAELFASTSAHSFDALAGGAIDMQATGIGALGVPGSRQLSTDQATVSAMAGEFNALNRPMSISYRNDAAFDISGQLLITAHVSGHDLAAPIPEPSGAALMLGGLAVLGMRALRRSR